MTYQANVTCTFKETCTSSYVTDHHSRENEMLIGVPIDNTMTVADVEVALRDEADFLENSFDEHVSMDSVYAAITEHFAGLTKDAVADKHAPTPAEQESDDCIDEPCQAWFAFRWDAAPNTITVPAWAEYYLLSGCDDETLTDEERAIADGLMAGFEAVERYGEPYFTWSYDLYDPRYKGGSVVDLVVVERGRDHADTTPAFLRS